MTPLFSLRVSCASWPTCCSPADHHGRALLAPIPFGSYADRERAVAARDDLQARDGRGGRHVFDVCELRADGWPLCPWCGEDELYSLATPASAYHLVGCYRCGTDPIAARKAAGT